jgi:hypothetical protein
MRREPGSGETDHLVDLQISDYFPVFSETAVDFSLTHDKI